MDLSLDALKQWVGRTSEATDIVTPRLVDEFEATFAPNLAPVRDGEAPLGLQWCLSPAISPMAGLGTDGHPTRGGFLPPVPLPRRMWAGGEVETLSGLRRGDHVNRRSVIEDVSLKSGRTGQLCFVAVRHEYRTERGLAIRERHDIVYRDAARPGMLTGLQSSEPRAPDRSWVVEATPTLLFRYSAMTFNGHRIHYDLPYATQEESYPGLVVHGPLQATLLFNMAAVLAERSPRRFSYRGQSPLTAGGAFKVLGTLGGDGQSSCWTEGPAGITHMTAVAVQA